MDYQQLFAISGAGMSLQRTQVEVSALNLANADTIAAEGSAAYQPLRVVAQSVLQGQTSAPSQFGALFNVAQHQAALYQLPEARIEASSVAPRLVHEPGHPAANAQGFVRKANVDGPGEMANLMRATRAYEANLMALSIGRNLALKTLDIGAGS